MSNTGTLPKTHTPTHKAAKFNLIMSLIMICTFIFLPFLKINGIAAPIWILPFQLNLSFPLMILSAIILWVILLFNLILVVISIAKYLSRLSKYPHHWSMESITVSGICHSTYSITSHMYSLFFLVILSMISTSDNMDSLASALPQIDFSIGMYIINICYAITVIVAVISFYKEFRTKVQRRFLNIKILFNISIIGLLSVHHVILYSVIKEMLSDIGSASKYAGGGSIALLLAGCLIVINLTVRDMLTLSNRPTRTLKGISTTFVQFFFFVGSVLIATVTSFAKIYDKIHYEYELMENKPIFWTSEADTKAFEQLLEWLIPFIPLLIIAIIPLIIMLILTIIRNILQKKYITPHEELDVIYNGYMTPELLDAYNAERKFRKKYPDRTMTIEDIMQEQAKEKNAKSKNNAPDTKDDELRKLKKLYDDGIITQEEFEAKKKQILGL